MTADPRTPSRAERERLRALAEQARDRLAEAQAIYAQEGQTPRWCNANLKYLVALGDYHGVCSPSVVLSLLAALDEGEQRATALGVDQEGVRLRLTNQQQAPQTSERVR